MDSRKKIFFIAFLFFTVALFFPSQQVFNFATTAILVITSFLVSPLKERGPLLRQRRYTWWMLAFFGLILVSVALSSNQKAGFRYLDSRLALLYFPLLIGTMRLERKFRDQLLLSFAIITTIFALSCLGYGIYRATTLHNNEFLYNDSLSEPITGHQSIYLSLLVNISIYIYAYAFFVPALKTYRGWFGLAIVLLFGCSFLLASRNLMLVLYGFTLLFLVVYCIKYRKYLELATLVMGLLIGSFAVYKFFPKTINRFRELSFSKFDYKKDGAESHFNVAVDSTQWNGLNTRLAVWRCGLELFRESPMMGIHLGDKKDKLMKKYEEKGFKFAIRTQKNLHSNYLDILVSLGIVGLIVFLIGWIALPLLTAWRYRDYLALIVFITFALAMVTENYFDRSLGGVLFGFFIPFLLSDKVKERKDG